MHKELKCKVFMALFGTDFPSRKEASEYVKKYFGKEAYKFLQELWKGKFICMNVHGYVDITARGYNYWEQFK